MIHLQGRYYDGANSQGQEARLSVAAHQCTLHTGGTQRLLDLRSVRVWDRVGNTPRRITWGGADSFVTSDNDSADTLQQQLNPNFSRMAHWLESNLTVAIASLVLIAAIYAVGLWWGIPYAARQVAYQIPESVSRQVASQTMNTLDEIAFEPSTLEVARQNELRAYLQAQDTFVGRIDFRASDHFGANALALPGGHFVITDELVCLAEHDEEILAVYLHEVGHARGRHGEAMALRNSAWLVVLTLITGDIGGVTDAIFTLPVVLGQMSFSRGLETEADDYAIAALQRLSIDPARLGDILERMSDPVFAGLNPCTEADAIAERRRQIADGRALDGDASDEQADTQAWLKYLSTHPGVDERIERMRGAGLNAAPDS